MMHLRKYDLIMIQVPHLDEMEIHPGGLFVQANSTAVFGPTGLPLSRLVLTSLPRLRVSASLSESDICTKPTLARLILDFSLPTNCCLVCHNTLCGFGLWKARLVNFLIKCTDSPYQFLLTTTWRAGRDSSKARDTAGFSIKRIIYCCWAWECGQMANIKQCSCKLLRSAHLLFFQESVLQKMAKQMPEWLK